MREMEAQKVDLLNFDHEDDNLLRLTPVKPDSIPLTMSLTPNTSMRSLGNSYGRQAAPPGVGGGPSANSVLSVLNFNEMNKRSVSIDESWLRKGYAVKESMVLDGIDEASPAGENCGTFSSRLSRTYLDLPEQGGVTPDKKGGEPTVHRKSRSRRSTTLRKSLAWDKAFFTDEGVLNNDELFAVASDTRKTLTMPELATIWDGPQPVVAPLEARITPTKSELGTEVKKEVIPETRKGISPALKAVVNPKPQQDVSRRPDILHTPSQLRPVRQTHTVGSHTFSNAYSRAAAIPQGSTLIPLPRNRLEAGGRNSVENSEGTGSDGSHQSHGSHTFSNAFSRAAAVPQGSSSIPLPRTGNRLEAGGRNPIENSEGTGSDQMKEPRSTSTGLYQQARLAALKKAHEAPQRQELRVRLPTSYKKAEDKQLEEIEKAKQSKKVGHKQMQEVHILKQSKLKAKASDELHQMNTTPKLTRSMSASAVIDSPSALSRKVSSMSKKVKETLGKVMTGRARRISTEPSLSHVHPVPMKKPGALPTVPEVKVPSHRMKPNSAVVPVKLSKDTFTVRDILRSKGPSLSARETLKQGPALLRSKSVAGVRGVPSASEPAPAPPVTIPPPPVQPSEPVKKMTGLRKPSPKLGFFDAGRVTPAPPKGQLPPQPLQGLQSVRARSEASTPAATIEGSAHRLESSGAESEGDTTRRAGLIGLENSNCDDESREPQTEKHNPSETTCNYPGISERESIAQSVLPVSSPHKRPEDSRPNEETKVADLPCDTPRSKSFREPYSRAANSCEASRDDPKPDSGCPPSSTPSSKDYSHDVSRRVSKIFDSPRSASFRELSYRTNTSADSPVAASKLVQRCYSQRISGGGRIGDSSPGVGPFTPPSASKRFSTVIPSHSPDSGVTFEVLNPSSSKNARGTRGPNSSEKKVVRKILDIESPSSQWSAWPVLGAVIPADQLPVSAKEELSSDPPRPLREQGAEQSTDARPCCSASLSRTSSLKVKPLESHEQCSSAMEQSSQSRLSFSTGFVGSPSHAMAAETDTGSMSRSSELGFIGAEILPPTPSGKKERRSSMLSLARMAVSRLTSSPAPSSSLTQEDGGTPRSSRKTSRRFSRPGSSSNCLSPELKPAPFSEERICELEAAGPEVLEKKSGPVQNSPPDKVIPETNPWSPVRKHGQPLGPFDCTKLKYISPVLTGA